VKPFCGQNVTTHEQTPHVI